MGQPGLNEFTKLSFPQIRKKALIIDVRGNGGGFVSPLVIERLRRALVMIEMSLMACLIRIRLRLSPVQW